jgi:hypothetical protein
LASSPETFAWTAEHFGKVIDHLPGLPSEHKWFAEITYPRFGQMEQDMFFSFRSGRYVHKTSPRFQVSHPSKALTDLSRMSPSIC